MNTDAAEALAQLAPMGAVEALAYWQEYRKAPPGWVMAENTPALARLVWANFQLDAWVGSPLLFGRCRLVTEQLYAQYLKQHHKT